MTGSEEQLSVAARLGTQAKAFLESELGTYLIGCSTQDLQALKDELYELDPYKFTTLVELQNAIVEIQNKGRQGLDLAKYLAEAIVAGNQADHVLREPEEP